MKLCLVGVDDKGMVGEREHGDVACAVAKGEDGSVSKIIILFDDFFFLYVV